MAVGVTTKKNIIPIIIGEMIFPRKIPNLNQILFKGVSNFEFINPKIKKKKDIINDHNLKFSLFMIGYKAIIKNTKKNTKPKLRFEPIFIFCFIFFLKIYI